MIVDALLKVRSGLIRRIPAITVISAPPAESPQSHRSQSSKRYDPRIEPSIQPGIAFSDSVTEALSHQLIAFTGSEEERKSIAAWFSGDRNDYSPSGERSVHLHLSPHTDLKIKGAGLHPDYSLNFHSRHAKGPKAFRFDYEGRRMDDVAIGHDTACLGGMSYQQASIEFLASAKFASLGYEVVPCIGWGSVHGARADEVSFFAVLRWDKRIVRANSDCPMDMRLELLKASAGLLVESHLSHRIASYFAVGRLADRDVLYDLHPTRMISELTDSPLSAAMQMIYNLRVRWWALKAHCGIGEEHEAISFADEVFRAVLPDFSHGECRAFEASVITPMLTGHGPQSYVDSLAMLESSRLSQHLLMRFRSILHGSG